VAALIASKFTCLQHAMDFNMGAWLLNAMRSEVLALHRILYVGDWPPDALHGFADQLDADAVAEAITGQLLPPM